MLASRRLDHFIHPASNNFSLIRLLAAASVVISHAVYLSTGDRVEPLSGITRYNLGQHAVNVFFIMSGLMVAGSLERSASLAHFAVARALRIFPALAVCAVVTAFLLGPWVTSLPLLGYFARLQPYLSPFQTLSLVGATHLLPGVFAELPVPGKVNDSLWTLKYEALCYVTLGGIAALGAGRSERAFRLVLAVSVALGVAGAVAWPIPSQMHALAQVDRFWFCFVLGVAFYRYRRQIPLSFGLLAVAATIWRLGLGTRLELALTYAVAGYGALVLATVPLQGLRSWTNRTDLSYGVYIYGWPASQLLIWTVPGIGQPALIAASLGLAAGAAWLSWTFVEQPSLLARKRLSEWLSCGLRVGIEPFYRLGSAMGFLARRGWTTSHASAPGAPQPVLPAAPTTSIGSTVSSELPSA